MNQLFYYNYYYGNGEYYQGYGYAAPGTYSLGQTIGLNDGFVNEIGGDGYYQITAIGESSGAAGLVYITNYHDVETNADYTPYYFSQGVHAGSGGLGDEYDFITASGTYYDGFGFGFHKADPAQASARNSLMWVRPEKPISPGPGFPSNFIPGNTNSDWVITSRNSNGLWTSATQEFNGEQISITFQDDLDIDYDYDEVLFLGIANDPATNELGFTQETYIVSEGAGSANFELSASSDIKTATFIIRNNEERISVNSQDVPLSIVDQSTVTSDLLVSRLPGKVVDVNVTLDITHSYDADLDVFLISPQGTRVELFTDVGSSGDNFTSTTLDDDGLYTGDDPPSSITSGFAPFTGSFSPEGLLTDFNLENPNGTWTLEIADDFAGDVGTLNNWSLELTIENDDSLAAPSNNSFDKRIALSGSTVTTTGSSVLASKQRGEPNHAGNSGGASVWWSWKAPQSGLVSIDTAGSSFDTLLGVYKGSSVSRLTQVASNDDYSGGTSKVAFAAKAGTTYKIAVDGNDYDANDVLKGNSGYVVLNVEPLESYTVSARPFISIPDDQTPITSNLLVSGLPGKVQDVDVKLDISHSDDADLDVFLISPVGTRVELFTDVGGTGYDGFSSTTLDDEALTSITLGSTLSSNSFRPEGLLSAFDGEVINGTWKLEITDDTAANSGQLYSWSLNFNWS